MAEPPWTPVRLPSEHPESLTCDESSCLGDLNSTSSRNVTRTPGGQYREVKSTVDEVVVESATRLPDSIWIKSKVDICYMEFEWKRNLKLTSFSIGLNVLNYASHLEMVVEINPHRSPLRAAKAGSISKLCFSYN